jgi:hypothetical protein
MLPKDPEYLLKVGRKSGVSSLDPKPAPVPQIVAGGKAGRG